MGRWTWVVGLFVFCLSAGADRNRCPLGLADYVGSSFVLFPGQAAELTVRRSGVTIKVVFPHLLGRAPRFEVTLHGRSIKGVGGADGIHFSTPSGVVTIPLEDWALVLSAGRADLLKEALRAGSRDRVDVLHGIESPESLAAHSPGLVELVDDLFLERVVLAEILAELPASPTLIQVVEKARDLVVARTTSQIEAMKARVGAEDRAFLETFDKALGQMRRHCQGAVKGVRRGTYADETFNYAHPRHAEFFDAVINGVFGGAGELMLAVRVPGLQAQGVKVRKFPPTADDIAKASEVLREEANLFWFEQEERKRLFAAWGVSPDDGPAIGAAIQANLRAYQLAMESARGRGPAPDPERALHAYVSKKFKTVFARPESVTAAFARLARQRASQFTVMRLRERLVDYFKPRVPADDLDKTVQRFLDKEIDLIYADHAYWGEVKNYGQVMTPELLEAVHHRGHGRRTKSILEQARENVDLARALMGPGVKVYQLVPDGFTLEAALMLEKEGVSIIPSSIVFPSTPRPR